MKYKYLVFIIGIIFGMYTLALSHEAEETPENNQKEERVELRRGIPVGVTGISYGERAMQRLVQQVMGTDEEANPNRLDDYMYRLRTRMITDSNFIPFLVETEYDTEEDLLTLQGHVMNPYHRDIPGIIFAHMGFKVQNNIQLLPDKEGLGEQLYAVQNSPTAYVYDQPDDHSEVVTQGLYGNHYFLLKKTGSYYFVHCDEGYLGYIHENSLQKFNEQEFTSYLNAPKAFLIKNIRIAEMELSAGSILKHLESQEDTMQVQLLNGDDIALPADIALSPLEEVTENISDMLEFARTYLGTGYDWGGKASTGLDCSGFTQMIYRSQGIQLPRDSYQQFLTGKLIATPWYTAALQPGDTLFFISSNTGRIAHVAVGLGGPRFIHAEVPVVSINSLDPADDDFSSSRLESFFYGKRPYAR